MPTMTLRGMFWMAVGMAALAMAMLVFMGGTVPLALFTMSVIMGAAAWIKSPMPGEGCYCGAHPPEGARFCHECGSRMVRRR